MLTYDDLAAPTEGAAAGPVFVGRGDLLDVIVGAIRQPDRRGTVLVSGYRGAGKTTLLIEAIRRTVLPKGWQLLPLVLNASEVSAALPAPATGAAPTTGPGSAPLEIGPQQLLTALIRTLRNHAESDKTLPADLKTSIQETYRKAIAKEYSRAEGDSQQRGRTLTRDFELKLTSADAYKRLAAAGGVAAVMIEGSAWLSNWATAPLHAVAIGAGALAVASWTASQKLTTVAKEETTQAVSVKYDNSLQQLEGDLKDQLSSLHRAQRRVVVILEELDKLRDEDGQQLDRVIRYFKNLFTQAPALFFFVTDKSYYDFIAGEIRRARRQRSYAIQHTFFTHRLFVGRPTTRDCLAYLKSIIANDDAGQRLDALYAAGKIDPFNPAIASDPLLRLMRYLLFKASNHLFDLKNEVRRFVRTNGPDLVIDTGSVTDDDVAAGIFQDLVVQKYGLFAFGDGRPYVNEVLNDCLYAVFSDVGADAVQQVASYYPRGVNQARVTLPPPATPSVAATQPAPAIPAVSAAQTVAAGAPALAPGTVAGAEDQLELSEQLRIKAAVDSLIEDLQRGGAFETERTNVTQGQFVWKRTAAQSFRFLRRLERHEAALLDRLEKLRTSVGAFATGGLLAAQANIRPAADAFLKDLDADRKKVQTTDHTLSVDETDKLNLEWQRRAAEPMAKAYRAHLDCLADRYGIVFEPIGSSVEGGTLLLLRGSSGDPRVQEGGASGAVLLAQGEGSRLGDDVREFLGRAPGLRRLAIVHVLHAPSDPTALTAREAQWRQQLADEMQHPTPDGQLRGFVVEALALDEGWPPERLSDAWGDGLALRVLLHAAWVGPALTAAKPTTPGVDAFTATVYPATHPNEPPRVRSFLAAMADWLEGDQRLLHVVNDSGSLGDESVCLSALSRVDDPEAVGFVWRGQPLSVFLDNVCRVMLSATGGRDKDDRVPDIVKQLMAEQRLLLILALPPTTDPKIDLEKKTMKVPIMPTAESVSAVIQLFGERGRVIAVAPASWTLAEPPGLEKTTLRLALPAQRPASNAPPESPSSAA